MSGAGKITVSVQRGNDVIASVGGLDTGDSFKFTNLPDGEYNLVAATSEHKVTVKVTVKNDLISKRDDAIAALPDTLTDEQRQDAIDELNKACDDAIKALDSDKSAREISDILNNAIQALRDVVEKSGGAVPAASDRLFCLVPCWRLWQYCWRH